MRRILVTGGNKGIGKAICSRLLSEWDDTYILLGSRNRERGEQAIAELTSELGEERCRNRLELIEIDTSSDESMANAADVFRHKTTVVGEVEELRQDVLYGIINNAGVMSRSNDSKGGSLTTEEVINTNYFGPKRVNEAFGPFLQHPGGRIVNIGSASGPMYVASLSSSDPKKELLAKPWLIKDMGQLDEMARDTRRYEGNSYGASKALLHAYTHLHAKANPQWIIHAVTPGWIQTDMTKGSGATNPPSKGAIPPCWALMEEGLANQPTGRYYGSDCVRSPLHVYRGPGDAPYVSDEDLGVDRKR